MRKYILLPVAVFFSMVMNTAQAQVTFSGTVETVMPELTITSMAEPVAHVKDFYIELDKDAVNCDLKTVEWHAQNTYLEGAKPLCLFEWTGNVNGLAANDLILSGVLDSASTVSFEYQVSIFDKGEKTVLLTDVYTVDVQAPEVPGIFDAIAKWSDGEVSGLSQETFGRTRQLRGVEVQVEPRPYVQVVQFRGASCEVDSGESSCFVSIESFVPGDGEPEAVGAFVDAFEVTDAKDYLAPQIEAFSIDYDYRAPEVVDFVINGLGEMEPISYNVDGSEFVIEENQALLVLSTPHSDKDGDWWIPRARDLRLTVVDETEESTRQMEVNGKTVLFPVNSAVPDSFYRIQERGEPQQINEYTVITYNISSLPDGQYEAQVQATDAYQNVRDEIVVEKLVDRNGPAIIGLLDDVQLRPGSPIETYFLNDVFFAAHGGWADGTVINSITSGGEPVDHTVINDKVVRLNHDPSLTSNEELVYEIEATDGNGNVTSEEFRLRYNPAEFRIIDVPSEVYEYVHELDMRLYQVGGTRCVAAATPEMAQAISTSLKKGCTVEFTNLPDGLSVSERRSIFTVEGFLGEQGTYNLDYVINFYNADGSSLEVARDSLPIDVVEVPPLEITLSDYNIISEGLYSVPTDADNITRAYFDRTNGEVEMTLSTDEASETITYRRGKRKRFSSESSFIEKIGDTDGNLWTKTEYTMAVEYPKIPGSRVEKTLDVVVTPYSKTKAYLDIELGPTGTTDDLATIQFNIGRYSFRDDSYNYDINTMGEWTVELAVETDDGYEVMGSPHELDANGQAVFTMSAQELFDAGDKYMAIASSKNGVPGFERKLESRTQRLKVLKGGAVEGIIEENIISDEVPFRTLLRFSYNTREDREVAGDNIWQVSADNVTWTDMPGEDDDRLYIETLVPGENYYRFKTVNKYTGVVNYSNVAKLMAYELMEFELEGPRKLIKNQQAEFTVVETSELVGSPDGTYEYSVDDGETWTEFMGSFTYGSDKDFILLVRNQLDSTAEDAGEESYSTYRHVARVEEADRVRPNLRNIRYAEANYPVELDASVRIGNSGVEANIISELVMPDGSVVAGTQHVYTIKESDVVNGSTDFTFRAWVEGFKDKTYAEDIITVPTKTYEFPSGEFYVSNYYSLTPAEIDLEIRGIDSDVHGVEFTTEWVIDENVFSIQRMRDDSVDLTVMDPGVHVVSVIVRDNRGNEQTYSEFITTESAPDMLIEYYWDVDKDSMRAPLAVDARIDVELGHRKDRIDTVDWYLNGVKQDGYTRYESVLIDEPGTHEIRVVVNSDFNQSGEYVQTLEVFPNIPPTCNPSIRMRDENRYVAHNCEDEDGDIMFVRYDWGTASKLNVVRDEYFSNLSYPSATVTITAVDDGGEEVTYEISW